MSDLVLYPDKPLLNLLHSLKDEPTDSVESSLNNPMHPPTHNIVKLAVIRFAGDGIGERERL